MTKLTAQAFRDLLSSVRDSISSLKSCQDREVPNERRLLENVMAELRAASPLRRNDDLIERKVEMLAEAQATLDARPVRMTETLTLVSLEPLKFPQPVVLPMSERVLMGDRYISLERLLSE